MEEETKKLEEIFILMTVAGMTLTEINTLSDRERFTLSTWFTNRALAEADAYKKSELRQQRTKS